MKKVINVYKHPYMWEVEFTFGTIEEMVSNRASVRGMCRGFDKSGKPFKYFHLNIGGSFNREMDKTNRAPLVQLGVEILVGRNIDYWREVNINDIQSVKFIQSCNWEGIYGYREEWDKFIEQGLFPVNANWNGKTYIKRYILNGKDKNGIPIIAGERYELVESYVY